MTTNPNAPMSIWGDSTTYNFNDLLRRNILSTKYFTELHSMTTMYEIINEISQKATHAEPWASGN